MTTWSPDTCQCVIDDYEHPHASFFLICPRHASAKPVDVLAENIYKNRTVAPLIEAKMPFESSFDDAGRLTIFVAEPARARSIVKDAAVTIDHLAKFKSR